MVLAVGVMLPVVMPTGRRSGLDLAPHIGSHRLFGRPRYPADDFEAGALQRLPHRSAHPAGQDDIHSAVLQEARKRGMIVLHARHLVHGSLLDSAVLRRGHKELPRAPEVLVDVSRLMRNCDYHYLSLVFWDGAAPNALLFRPERVPPPHALAPLL